MVVKYVLTEDELLSLLTDSRKLNYLEYAGVDNWSGYWYAGELMEDDGFEEAEEAALEDIKAYTKQVEEK